MIYTFVRTTAMFTILMTLFLFVKAARGEYVTPGAVWWVPVIAAIFGLGWTFHSVTEKEDAQ